MSLFRPRRLAGILVTFSALMAGFGAQAQGINCSKAQAPLDRAICASPELLAQDRAMADAFARALAQAPDQAALRQSQIAWLRERAAGCTASADQAAMQACLLRFGQARLAVLTPKPPAAPVAAAPAANPPAANTPVAAASPVTTLAESPVVPAPPAVSAEPAAATIDRPVLPAAEQMETLLHVTHPGRFAIAAKSPTGTAIQLVDMLTGPTDLAGEAGQTDGRLDLLLDTGTYKLRAFGAAHAIGDVSLSVAPFRDAGPAQGAPLQGTVDAELGDLQQRTFWLVVGEQPIWIEAAGRALGDLRLFRDGRELAALLPTRRVVEPVAGHPLNDFFLQGRVPPGTYEIVAYGGRRQNWADGATAQPFHIRTAPSEALEAGFVAARIGPFGSAFFRVGPAVGSVRLDLPQPADASLSARIGDQVFRTTLDRRQREPTAWLSLNPGRADPAIVELRAAEGQTFSLRALSGVTRSNSLHDGPFWMSIDGAGYGGDESPLTYVLTDRRNGLRPAVRASAAPQITPTQPWRRRFNLRGQFAMVFEVTTPGPVAVHAEGVAVQAAVAPFGAALQPNADGTTPASWDLAAGFYVLQLTPLHNGAGILDLTLGPPGKTADLPAVAATQDPAVPIGLVTLQGDGELVLYASRAAGATLGLAQRPAPVDLAAGPLALTLAARAGIDVPVRFPSDGNVAATEIGAGPTPVGFDPVTGPTAGRIGTVHVPPADHERTVALSWHKPAPAATPIPPVPPVAQWPVLTGGGSRFLDLARDASATFALNVPEGGLYRVETLGRLHTTGALGSAYDPSLADADGNGVGHNMLIQRFLRAGQYRVTVGATDSNGHLGVAARPAPLAAGATLVPGGSVRARLPEGTGIAFPVEIADAGTYHLDLLSLAGDMTTRIEDAEGWPIVAAGDLSSLDQTFRPGHYRLVVQPATVAARVVARLARVETPAPHTGHGPFPLPFDSTQRNQWREPPGRDDARTPDSWTFALLGPAAIRLAIGDGMEASLLRTDGQRADGGDTLARFTHATPYAGTLPAGSYRVAATGQGRNDRLDYALTLSSEQLQPDRPRTVTLPATVRFAIAEERVVSLTSFGTVPLRGVLKDAAGHVVDRPGERGDDWNLGVSRLLPAGAYSLALSAAVPPAATDVAVRDPARAPAAGDDSQPSDSDDDADQAMGGDQSGTDQANNDQANTGPSGNDQANGDQSSTDQATGQQADNDSTDSDTPKQTELRLALPASLAPVAAGRDGSLLLTGGGVHRLTLPPQPADSLNLAFASSTAELALALEQRDSGGAWRTLALAQGTAPVIGTMGNPDAPPPRLSVWTVDGGNEPIRFAARMLAEAAQPLGPVTGQPVALADMPQKLGAVLVAVPGAGPVTAAGTGVSGVSGAGRVLSPADGGLLLPQGDRLWVVTQPPGPVALSAADAQPGQPLALAIPEAGSAMLPAPPVPAGHTRLWLASSGLGQPGLDAGRGMGVAEGSALALAADPARVFNASGSDALRLRVTALDLADQTPRTLDTPLSEALPPHSALAVRLPDGAHALFFDLAPGTAAIADWRGPAAVSVWTGDAPVSRRVETASPDVLLVNTGDSPAPVGVAWTDLPSAPFALVPGTALKRFFGAAGSVDLPVTGPGRLVVAGGTARMIGPGGRVTQGRVLKLDGAGRVVLTHGPGLLAAWIEGGPSPWPEPAPQMVQLPQTLPLHDAAMTLAFAADGPVLLHARSTAPVILALGAAGPTLYPAGAEFNRVVAGAVSLRVISPHDGPLSGSLALSADPILTVGEGLGSEVAVAPGGSAAFSFAVPKTSRVGVGVRAEPDQVSVRLLRADGHVVGDGVAQLQELPAGRYVLEAQVPVWGTTTRLRPAVVGIVPRSSAPPPDIINTYLALAGKSPK